MAKKGKKKTAAPPTRRNAPARSSAGQGGRPRTSGQSKAPPAPEGVVTIRKYSNRRLYDTAASAHLTQEDLYRMVSGGATVRILDATTGEDITNQTLATALIEHDPGKLRLMPTWLLHQMIRLHEQAIGGWLSGLWPPLAGAGGNAMPGWPSGAGVWPGSGGAMGLGGWAPWPAGSPAATPPESSHTKARQESLDELRREVSRLVRRLGELEESG